MLTDLIRKRISALQPSNETVSHLPKCTLLLLEGYRGTPHANNSSINSDRVPDKRLSSTLWLLEGQLAAVQGTIENALQVPGAKTKNELLTMAVSILLFAAMGGDALSDSLPDRRLATVQEVRL
jgi:hypothetical protein